MTKEDSDRIKTTVLKVIDVCKKEGISTEDAFRVFMTAATCVAIPIYEMTAEEFGEEAVRMFKSIAAKNLAAGSKASS